jgi:hypothetical protein
MKKVRARVACAVAAAFLTSPACSRHEPPGQAPPSPRAITQAPIPIAPPAAAPPPPERPRPAVAVMFSSGTRGHVTAKDLPRQLPPGVGLTPLAPRESTGGLARRATIVDQARVQAAAVVQVDAGDFLPPVGAPPDPAAAGPKAADKGIALVLAAYRRLGVDAATLGEEELGRPGLDPRKLAARLAAGHLTVVLANLVDRKGAPVFDAEKVIDAAGVPVGVLGVSEVGEAASAALSKAGYTLGDPVAAARAAAHRLRERGARVVVALVHAPAGRARAISDGLAEIDLVVASAENEAAAGKPRVVVAGADTVGRADVRLPAQGPPELEDRVVALAKDVHVQLGVDLLSRVPTIPLIDTKKMEAAMARGDKRIKMRDLYESWDYGSTKACGYCHEKQVAQWQTTDHARAFATLKKAKRDADPTCLGCHVMGFLQPGGTRDIVMIQGGFADVGCESCHGPSAEHVRSADKKLGTSRKVSPTVCLGCHTPDQNLGDFDPVAATKEVLGPGHGAP